MARPPRLVEFDYLGPIAVCFTIVTLNRQTAFLDDRVASHAIAQLLQLAESFDVEITAYCVMPDHTHILATGLTDRAETLTMIVRWKQRLGFWYRARTRSFLWQPGYWDRVLRDEDNVMEAVAYILANPLRVGLVRNLLDYKWIGSSRWSVSDLVDVCQDAERPKWW